MERPGEGEAAAALSPSSEWSGSKSIWSTLAFPSSPGLVRLTRLLEVGLDWAHCLESPFGNQNAYDFVRFLQKLFGAWREPRRADSRGPQPSRLHVLADWIGPYGLHACRRHEAFKVLYSLHFLFNVVEVFASCSKAFINYYLFYLYLFYH